MPTAVVLGERVHMVHPDKDNETFCGVEYDDFDRLVSMTVDANDLMAHVLSDDSAGDERCDQCIEDGREWAVE
jgi:hypothetical protein